MFVENWTGDNTTASILFCLRIDYNLNGESINFHETVVDVTIDLTSNFTLDAVNVVRTSATDAQQDVDVDYPVTAYFCDGNNAGIAAPTFTQGGAMQFCVKKDVRDSYQSCFLCMFSLLVMDFSHIVNIQYPTFDNSQVSVSQDVYVRDILTAVVTQPSGPGTPTTAIDTYVPNALTTKDCTSNSDGICNLLTQLPSKYFVDVAPQDLRVSGTAVLAFGTARKHRLLHVPVRNLRHLAPANEGIDDRQLQQQQEGGSQSEFDLTAKLEGNPVAAADSDDGDSNALLTTVIAVLGVVAVASLGCGVYYNCAARRSNNADDESNSSPVSSIGKHTAAEEENSRASH